MSPRPRTRVSPRPDELAELAGIRDDLQRTDPTLSRAFARLTDAPFREWWTRPLAWWIGAPVGTGLLVLALRLFGLAALAGLSILLLLGGLALVTATLPDGDMSTSRQDAVSRSRGVDGGRSSDT